MKSPISWVEVQFLPVLISHGVAIIYSQSILWYAIEDMQKKQYKNAFSLEKKHFLLGIMFLLGQSQFLSLMAYEKFHSYWLRTFCAKVTFVHLVESSKILYVQGSWRNFHYHWTLIFEPLHPVVRCRHCWSQPAFAKTVNRSSVWSVSLVSSTSSETSVVVTVVFFFCLLAVALLSDSQPHYYDLTDCISLVLFLGLPPPPTNLSTVVCVFRWQRPNWM